MEAVTIRKLRKEYNRDRVVDDIDLTVHAGESFGFIGPNGAGKSTTVKMLCTLVKPTGGTAEVAGYDVRRHRDDVRRNIGLVFQETTLDGYLTVMENLRMHATLYGVPRSERRARIEEFLTLVGLADHAGAKAKTLSGGMRRRLEIVRGLLHLPRVLFLDEPTVGLDPQARNTIWAHLAALKRRYGLTIFLTTHYLEEAENCDRVAIIDRGRIVTVGTPEALKASVGKDRVRLRSTDAATVVATLRRDFGISASIDSGQVTFAVADGDRFIPRLFETFRSSIQSVYLARPTLDDVFAAYTGHSIDRPDGTDS